MRKFRQGSYIFFLLILLTSICHCGGGSGGSSVGDEGSISLAWDPNSDPDLAGYRVYFGTASGSYEPSAEVLLSDLVPGDTVNYQINGLTIGQTYFIAVTAFDSDGKESDFSNEVSGEAR